MAVKKKKVITKKPAPKKSRIIAKKVSVKKPKKRKEKPRPEKYKVVVSGDGKMLWQGYGIDSITTFLNDVCSIYKGQKEPIDFEGFRPTFKEAVISTAVIEAAGKSLEDSGNWKAVEGLL